jgi:hypothetical protein
VSDERQVTEPNELAIDNEVSPGNGNLQTDVFDFNTLEGFSAVTDEEDGLKARFFDLASFHRDTEGRSPDEIRTRWIAIKRDADQRWKKTRVTGSFLAMLYHLEHGMRSGFFRDFVLKSFDDDAARFLVGNHGDRPFGYFEKRRPFVFYVEKGRAEEFYRRTVATHHEVLETLWRRSEALGTTSSIWVPVVFLSEKSFEACSEWTGASEQYSFYNQGLEAIICRLPKEKSRPGEAPNRELSRAFVNQISHARSKRDPRVTPALWVSVGFGTYWRPSTETSKLLEEARDLILDPDDSKFDLSDQLDVDGPDFADLEVSNSERGTIRETRETFTAIATLFVSFIHDESGERLKSRFEKCATAAIEGAGGVTAFEDGLGRGDWNRLKEEFRQYVAALCVEHNITVPRSAPAVIESEAEHSDLCREALRISVDNWQASLWGAVYQASQFELADAAEWLSNVVKKTNDPRAEKALASELARIDGVRDLSLDLRRVRQRNVGKVRRTKSTVTAKL